VRLSPTLSSQATYPFLRLEQAKRAALQAGVPIIDFGQGDPRQPAPALVREALVAGLAQTMGYPKTEGLPELREAIAAWLERRFRVRLDPAREIIPTLGSKEAIFTFASVVLDPESGKDTVVVCDPAYPVYERGALFAGARVVRLPLREENAFLPDLEELDPATLSRVALVWVNYPNNPTASVCPLAFYERLTELAREYDFLVCSDEAYSEIWFREPPPSALQARDRSRVVVFNTLSKRSSMTGYRAGFVAGPAWVIDGLRRFRPAVGTAPQEFVQRAAIAAWGDEAHVEEARVAYARKREVLLSALSRAGYRVAGAEATMYLWVEVPGRGSSEQAAHRFLKRGIVVAPGSYLGRAGEGYMRLALVPTLEECERAASLLEKGGL